MQYPILALLLLIFITISILQTVKSAMLLCIFLSKVWSWNLIEAHKYVLSHRIGVLGQKNSIKRSPAIWKNHSHLLCLLLSVHSVQQTPPQPRNKEPTNSSLFQLQKYIIREKYSAVNETTQPNTSSRERKMMNRRAFYRRVAFNFLFAERRQPFGFREMYIYA